MNTNVDLLTRRVAKILPDKEGLEKLVSSKKIRLYQGVDPTFNKLHLGHTIGFRKLMDFANEGHEVILLFGTGTVLVGDPSLRDTGRKLITQEEVEENIREWQKQVSPIIDFEKVQVRQNGDWLTQMTLKDIIHVASNISAIQLFKRDNFTRRIGRGDTVWYHETMYPMLQGYDSVVMDVDLEVGGTDQEFNMLVGRELQKKMNNHEKYVLTVPMIMGTDGKTMSKTSGNCIWLTDSAEDMYTKLMAVQDDLVATYFELLTDIPMAEIKALDPSKPVENKKKLAFDITRQFHGNKDATEAQAYFEKIVQTKSVPPNIPVVEISMGSLPTIELAKIISPVTNSTTSDMKRIISQGGFSINEQKVTDLTATINIEDDAIVKVGKNSFIKLKKTK